MGVPGDHARRRPQPASHFLRAVKLGDRRRPGRIACRRHRRRQRRHGHGPDRPAAGRRRTSPSSTGAAAPRCRPTTSRRTTPRRRGRSSTSRPPRSRSSTTATGAPARPALQRMAAGRRRTRRGRSRPEPVAGQRVRHRLRRGHRRRSAWPRHRRRSPARLACRHDRGRLVVDERTRSRRDVPWLFAAGDVVTGASDITRADRRRPTRRLHDRPLDPGPDPRRASTCACRSSTRTSRARPPEGLPTGDAGRRRARSSAPPRPTSARSSADDRGRGALRRRAVPRLRRLLRVRRVRRRLPGRRLHRPARHATR